MKAKARQCECLRESQDARVGTMWEGGHYYLSKGPTQWSTLSWSLVMELKGPDDHTLIMVDDIHPLDLVNEAEVDLAVESFSPKPCVKIKESEMAGLGMEVLEQLKKLSKKHRARQTFNPKRWCCSGYALTNSNHGRPGEPTCLLYDLGLAKYKRGLGFRRIVNVLPEFYKTEQIALIQIAKKAIPDLRIEAVLFDLSGKWRWLRPEDIHKKPKKHK